MKKLLSVLLTIVFLQNQAFGLGFAVFTPKFSGVLNPEIEGLNRDISNTQETGNGIITGALDGSVTVDNRLLLGFLMKREVKDKEGNTREASRDFYRTLYSKLNAIYCLHNKPFIQQLYT